MTIAIPRAAKTASPPGTRNIIFRLLSILHALSSPFGKQYIASSARRFGSSMKTDAHVMNPPSQKEKREPKNFFKMAGVSGRCAIWCLKQNQPGRKKTFRLSS